MKPTITLAIPGSIIGNAQTPALRTFLAGQIARALAVFEVDEVVVFGEGTAGSETSTQRWDLFLLKLLSYLETPQYLRKSLFPISADLRSVGILAPLDTPHHMRIDEWSRYREGVTKKMNIARRPRPGMGSLVNVGLWQDIRVDKMLRDGIRITVDMGPTPDAYKDKKGKVRGRVVSPDEPRKAGFYWGYTTRLASTISKVFSESPYDGGYDCTIGTSERGTDVYEPGLSLDGLTAAKHVLIVFGGVHGLEDSVEADPDVLVDSPAELFDYYLNTCPHQGSRTIRTEEAIFISMAGIQHHLAKAPWWKSASNSLGALHGAAVKPHAPQQ